MESVAGHGMGGGIHRNTPSIDAIQPTDLRLAANLVTRIYMDKKMLCA